MILVFNWLKQKKNHLLWNRYAKWKQTLKEVVVEVPFQNLHILSRPDKNVAAMDGFCFWFAETLKKSSALKIFWPMEQYFVG